MLDFKGDWMFFKEPAANVALGLTALGGFLLFIMPSTDKWSPGAGELFVQPFEVNAYGTSDAAIEAMAMEDTLAALIGYR